MAALAEQNRSALIKAAVMVVMLKVVLPYSTTSPDRSLLTRLPSMPAGAAAKAVRVLEVSVAMRRKALVAKVVAVPVVVRSSLSTKAMRHSKPTP